MTDLQGYKQIGRVLEGDANRFSREFLEWLRGLAETINALPSNNTPAAVAAAGSAGTSDELSRSDHVHALTFTVINALLAGANAALDFNNQDLTDINDISMSGNLVSTTGSNAIDAFSVWRANNSQDITVRDSVDGGAVTFSWQTRSRIGSSANGLFEFWNNDKNAYCRIFVSGVSGTVTNDNATAGDRGEYQEASAADNSVTTWTTAAPKDITSLSLTAGDWDVHGEGEFGNGAITGTGVVFGLSTASATFQTGLFEVPSVPAAGGINIRGGCYRRISIASTTTVYLVGQITFTGGTPQAGGVIRARRVR
jgi:hypothetical protein